MHKKSGPKGLGSDVRSALIEAGCMLWHENGIDGVSLREVADRASVNPAMVRYYFKDKSGFEKALLDTGLSKLLAGVPEEASFQDTFEAAFSSLNTMPWLVMLILRTVHLGDSLREYAMENYFSHLWGRLGASMLADSKMDLLCVMSMLVFPQVSRASNGSSFQNFDEDFIKSYAAHVNGLFSSKNNLSNSSALNVN